MCSFCKRFYSINKQRHKDKKDVDYMINKKRTFHSKCELAKNIIHESYFVDFNGKSYDLQELERRNLIKNDYRFNLQAAFNRKILKNNRYY